MPQSIIKKIRMTLEEEIRQTRLADSIVPQDQEEKQVYKLEEEMLDAASELDFEKASRLRNRIREISPDVVFTGRVATDRDNAAVGPMVATLLGWPCVTEVVELQLEEQSGVAKSETETGIENPSMASLLLQDHPMQPRR